MFNHLEMTREQFEEAVELGYIVDADVYNEAAVAEEDGFFWEDSWDRWISVEKLEVAFK